MLSKRIRLLAALWIAGSFWQTAGAFDCRSYDDVAAKLNDSFGEQMVFSGFSDSDQSPTSNAVYEFWINPERGNWSLVAHKVFLFQDDASERVFSRSCAFIVNSGKRHQIISQEPVIADNNEFGLIATVEPAQPDGNSAETEPQAAADANEPAAVEPDTASTASTATAANQITPYMNCIPHDRHAKALKERYNEVPVVQALAEDDTVLEIYGSDNSWTITRAKIREVRNTMTGRPLTNEKTGQKIHQLCSDPAYSGKTWSLFELSFKHI